MLLSDWLSKPILIPKIIVNYSIKKIRHLSLFNLFLFSTNFHMTLNNSDNVNVCIFFFVGNSTSFKMVVFKYKISFIVKWFKFKYYYAHYYNDNVKRRIVDTTCSLSMKNLHILSCPRLTTPTINTTTTTTTTTCIAVVTVTASTTTITTNTRKPPTHKYRNDFRSRNLLGVDFHPTKPITNTLSIWSQGSQWAILHDEGNNFISIAFHPSIVYRRSKVSRVLEYTC